MSRRAPLVTIGLPVFNGARFLEQAIESLLDQTFSDLELVISDNVSTDATAEICLAYAAKERRIRYLRRTQHVGAPANWNSLVGHARGKYLKWSSANDFCAADLVEKCVSVMEAEASVAVCQGKTCLIDEESGTGREYDDDITATYHAPSERFRKVSRDLALNNVMSGLIRLDLLRDTRLIRPYQGGDTGLLAELALRGQIVVLPEVLFFRRIGRQSFSSELSESELRAFLDPEGRARPGFRRLRRHVDHIRTIASAPINLREKARALSFAGQNLVWDRRALWSEMALEIRREI